MSFFISLLGEQGVPGRAYLEKILQVAVDLPKLPPAAVQRQLLRAIDSVVSEISAPGPFDESAWPDILMEIIRPLVRNMRDVRRYSTAIRGTLLALNGQVALADVLGVEAVRIFLPDVFVLFHDAVDGLTTVSDGFYSRRSTIASLKVSIEALVSAGKQDDEVIKSMIRRLFPAAQQHIENYHFGLDFVRAWLRERRIAHADILRLYLERVAGEGLLAFTDAERGIDLMADQAEFDKFLRLLSEERLQDVIASFENFEGQFEAKNVQGGVIVLLNLLANLPERPGGMFTVRPELAVTRVVLRMLRSLPDTTTIESTVTAVLPQLLSLHAKQVLINMVGHRTGVGHKLVSEPAGVDFAKGWRAEVRSASPDALQRENDLLFLLFWTRRESVSGEPQLTIPAIPSLTFAILSSATSEIASQTLGNRAVRRSPQIEWDALIEVFDGEDNLKARIKELKAAMPDADPQLMALVERYCDGWRPKLFEI